MARFVAAATILVSLGWAVSNGHANDGVAYPGAAGNRYPAASSGYGVVHSQPTSHGVPVQSSMGYGSVPGVETYNTGMYPVTHAPLYPSPVQHTPAWNGGTIITNQAFAPHEMLYPHTYRAMYPPFYYKVRGCWIWTPFGMRQHEHWELQGTEVKVNYRSRISCLSGFHVPRTH